MTNFDLHMHSNVSRDGQFTPTELVALAKQADLQYIALSDHNDFRGIEAMQTAANKEGITVIPAIEFDTMFLGNEVHLLGYNIDYTHPYFDTLGKHIDEVMDAAMAERFVLFRKNFGVTLDEAAVYAQTPEGENPFFTLVAMMLNDPANQDIPAFQDYLPGGKRHSPQVVNFYWDHCCVGTQNYVAVDYPDFKETVDLIHQTGGIAVLAHPWKTFYQKEDLLKQAMKAGVDGIEAYSNYHEPYHNEFYEAFCQQHDLIITCGSDFHGNKKPDIKMGQYGYRKEDGAHILEKFLAAIHHQ